MRMLRCISLLMCLLLLGGCSAVNGDDKHSKTGFYFDTTVTVTLYGGSADWIDEAFALCERYEQIFSRTDPASELYRLNHTEAPVTVSQELATVIGLALDYSRISGGRFDITTAAYADLWDFTGEHPTVPDADALQAAGSRVGYQKVILDGRTVTLQDGAQIDLGGIAKGYIADRLAALFTEKGANAVISLGGNIYLTGEKPDKTPFTVGIKDPENTAALAATVKLSGGLSVVTSGDYERSFTQEGVRYHHILDAATGMPADSDLRSATVIAASSADADALSTVCFLLGAEGARTLIEQTDGAEAVLIGKDGEVIHTSGVGADKAIQMEYS